MGRELCWVKELTAEWKKFCGGEDGLGSLIEKEKRSIASSRTTYSLFLCLFLSLSTQFYQFTLHQLSCQPLYYSACTLFLESHLVLASISVYVYSVLFWVVSGLIVKIEKLWICIECRWNIEEAGSGLRCKHGSSVSFEHILVEYLPKSLQLV